MDVSEKSVSNCTSWSGLYQIKHERLHIIENITTANCATFFNVEEILGYVKR